MMASALELLGYTDEATCYCDNQWVMLPTAIVCFCILGPSKSQPHLKWSAKFAWVADQLYHTDNPIYRFCPVEIRAGDHDGRPIFLFAQPDKEKPYLYLGRLSAAFSYGKTGRQRYGMSDPQVFGHGVGLNTPPIFMEILMSLPWLFVAQTNTMSFLQVRTMKMRFAF